MEQFGHRTSESVEDFIMLVSEDGIVGASVSEVFDVVAFFFFLDRSVEHSELRPNVIVSMLESKGKLPLN